MGKSLDTINFKMIPMKIVQHIWDDSVSYTHLTLPTILLV